MCEKHQLHCLVYLQSLLHHINNGEYNFLRQVHLSSDPDWSFSMKNKSTKNSIHLLISLDDHWIHQSWFVSPLTNDPVYPNWYHQVYQQLLKHLHSRKHRQNVIQHLVDHQKIHQNSNKGGQNPLLCQDQSNRVYLIVLSKISHCSWI